MPADRLLHPRAGKSHKVSMLTDLEYRVWTQYLLSADDFGVMRATPLAFQNDNDHLAGRKAREIQRCIDTLIAAVLVGVFSHQGKPYLYQRDWQTWQKVDYPRATLEPKPDADALDTCDDPTRRLFDLHPGGKGKKFREPSKGIPEAPVEFSKADPEKSPSTAGAQTRVVASGYRLEANGKRQEADGGERFDLAFNAFRDAYPASRRKGGWHVQTAFIDQAGKAGGVAALMAALVNHVASEQWADEKHVPGMDVWLLEERWRQVLPARGATTPTRASSEPSWAAAAKAARKAAGLPS